MSRKKRMASSCEAIRKIEAAAEADVTIAPPGHFPLDEAGMAYWRDFIGGRSPNDWAHHELCLLEELCIWMAHKQRLYKVIELLGDVEINDQGKRVPTVEFDLAVRLDMLADRRVKLLKLATQADPRTLAKSAKLVADAKRVKNAAAADVDDADGDDDSLLAT